MNSYNKDELARVRRTNNVNQRDSILSLAASPRRNIGATYHAIGRRPATGPAPKTVPKINCFMLNTVVFDGVKLRPPSIIILIALIILH